MIARVLVPSGTLGLGYDLEALAREIEARPDIIVIDSGSTDSGMPDVQSHSMRPSNTLQSLCHFSQDRLDSTHNLLGFPWIERIGMRRGKLTAVIVEILAGGSREFIG